MASNSYLSKEVTEINICIVFTQNAINLSCLEQLKNTLFIELSI